MRKANTPLLRFSPLCKPVLKDFTVWEVLLFLLLCGVLAGVFAGGLFPAHPSLLLLLFSALTLPYLPRAAYEKGDIFLWFFLFSLAITGIGRGWEWLIRLPLITLFFLPRCLGARNRSKLLCFLLSAAGISGTLAIGQAVLGGGSRAFSDAAVYTAPRAFALLGNPNLLAALLSSLFPLALSFLWERKGRLFGGTCALLLLGGLAATYSRMALLAGGVGTLLFLLWQTPSPHTWLWLLPGAPVLLPNRLFHRIFGIFSARETSGSYRLSLWKSLFRLPPATLLFGVGAGRAPFLSALSTVASAGLEKAEHSHLLPLGILLTAGGAGLFSFLFLLLSRLPQAASSAREKALICSLVCFLLCGLTDDVFYDRRLFAFFFLLFGFCLPRKEPICAASPHFC